MYSIYQVASLAQARHRDLLAEAEQQRLVREVRQTSLAARRAARPAPAPQRHGWLSALRFRPQAHA
jgi:hypothetical protein